MNNSNLNQLLQEVQFACFSGIPPEKVAVQLNQLTRAKDPQTERFLIECLKNRQEDWRIQALMSLSTIYDPGENHEIVSAIDDFVRQEPNPQLRQKGVEILSIYASYPNEALIDVLENDPVNQIRFAALRAILEIKGVKRLVIRDEVGLLQVSGVMPTVADIDRISRKASGQFTGFFE